jgi:hypothetical protein
MLDVIFAKPEVSTWIIVTQEGVSKERMCAIPHTHTQLIYPYSL